MTDKFRFPNSLAVVGLPDADSDKIPKMKDFLLNKMKERGCSDWTDCDVITDSDGKSKGVAIITFESEKDARKFFTEINNGFKFGKNTLGIVRLDDVESTLMKDADELAASSGSGFLIRDKLHYYTQDDRCREQLLIRNADNTTIAWLDSSEAVPVIEYDGERERAQGLIMTDKAAFWSPKGSFLVTLHKRGVSLWGGAQYERLMRFEHSDVFGISFSPNEEYLLTWNGVRHQDKSSVTNTIRLFEVQTAALLSTFDCPVDTRHSAKFPALKWSADSKYLAGIFGTMKQVVREVVVQQVAPGFAAPQADPDDSWEVEKANLVVFSIPECKPVTTLKRPTANARQLAWAPRGSRLAYWNCESGSQPSAIEIVNLPDGRLLGSKNVFKAVDCNLQWHPRGDFLSALMRIASKSGKTFSPALEILRTGEGLSRGVPVESFKLPADATIKFFAWDPAAPRFVYMSEIEGHSRVRKLHLCTCRSETTVEVAVLELAQPFNACKWSPLGTHLAIGVYATKGQSLDGNIWHLQVHGGNELNQQPPAKGNKNNNQSTNPLVANSRAAGETPSRIEILQMNKNFMLNYLDWDYSGRFILAAVRLDHLTNPSRYISETGYTVYTFQGRLILNESKKSHLLSVAFRPHPTQLLTDAQVENARKDLKTYSKKFEAADDFKRQEQSEAYKKVRTEQQEIFKKVLDHHTAHKESTAAAKAMEWADALRDFESKRKYREVEEVCEEVLEITEEVVEAY